LEMSWTFSLPVLQNSDPTRLYPTWVSQKLGDGQKNSLDLG
jgi:hypothetical protein